MLPVSKPDILGLLRNRPELALLHLADAQYTGDLEYNYRLRVSEPRPDFALRVVPSSVSGRAGAKASITVHALRWDGFAGEIGIVLRNAPPGFKLSDAVPANKDQATFTLTLRKRSRSPWRWRSKAARRSPITK